MANKILLACAIFILSLDSYLRLRGIIGLGLLSLYIVISINSFRIDKKFLNILITIFSIVFIYTLLAIFFPDQFLQIPEDKDNFILKILDRVSLILLFIAICIVFNNDENLKILYWIIKIHVLYLLAQFIILKLFNYEFSILKVFNIEQRSTMTFNGVDIFRPSGLYIEPSNYAAYILCLFFPFLIKKNKYSFFDFLVPISILLTLSSAAFVIGFLLIIVMLLKSNIIKNKKYISILIVATPLLLFFLSKQAERFNGGISENENTVLRLNLINSITDSRLENTYLALLGNGIYSYDYNIYKLENTHHGRYIASIQDATFILFSFIIFGVFGILFIIFSLLYTKGFYNKLFVLIFFLSKMSFFFPVFMFFLYFLIQNNKTKNIQAKHVDLK